MPKIGILDQEVQSHHARERLRKYTATAAEPDKIGIFVKK
jgi:hypothetical protein